jgi:hypothetical protein
LWRTLPDLTYGRGSRSQDSGLSNERIYERDQTVTFATGSQLFTNRSPLIPHNAQAHSGHCAQRPRLCDARTQPILYSRRFRLNPTTNWRTKTMTSFRVFAAGLVIVFLCGSAGIAATVQGAVGDGEPSVAYIAATGEMTIQPDREPVGLFQILSASGVFTGNAILPPASLGFDINTNNEKAWAVLAQNSFVEDFSLGVIAPSGLTLDFLLNDFTMVGSGGFGTATFIFDLVYYAPGNTPPRGADALVHFPAAGSGVTFNHQFSATDSENPATALVWTNLEFSLDGLGTPQFQPTLSPTGLFTWDTTGSPRGIYTATAIVTDLGGYADMTVLTINTTPEPTTAALCSLAMIWIALLRTKRPMNYPASNSRCTRWAARARARCFEPGRGG